MSLSPPQSSAFVVHARAASVARRLLAGAGVASLVAYRRDAHRAVAVLAHGVTAAGDFVVAHLADSVPGGAGGEVEVRVDIRREATDARVRILSATVHLLGRIEWLPAASGDLLGALPESIDVLSGVPNVVLGVVRADKVLVHDGAGVSSFGFAELVDGDRQALYPTAREEFDAQETVAALGPDLLYGLYAAALHGQVRADVLCERALQPVCGATIGRIYCVDVDALGLTLMHVGASLTSVVFIPFPEPVHGHAQMRARVAGLLPVARS